MTPMSIADIMMRPGAIFQSASDGQFYNPSRKMRADLMRSKFIRCDAIANAVWRDHTPGEHPRGHKPTFQADAPYRPPFDDMWIEWTVAPDLMHLTPARVTDVAVGFHVIPVADWTPRPQGLSADAAFGIVAEKFVKSGHGFAAVTWCGTDNWFVNASGHFVANLYIADGLHKGITAEQHQQEFTQFGVPALSALALMNCKNVNLVACPAPRRSKKSKPERIPRIEFHTVRLPGVNYGDSANPTEPTHQEMAHHFVRGHFKTYTADAPLLGRAVGTYWWGWQTRGAKKNGITVTDYEVAPLKAPAA